MRAAGSAHADAAHGIAQGHGDAEVGNLQIHPAVHHQIRRLEIAMDETGGVVRVGERVAQRGDPGCDLNHFETFAGFLDAQ